ncbi:condensation domain-containing protein [Kitasatospora phosalacinea]|uniref:condensation domain-containing protein n=1 Tax=Kitasatospora phosalacinea TaxID=2065 RepID=UPI00131C9820|nr:condensation domain-containing protein [Kitasatospora phosalacinea]
MDSREEVHRRTFSAHGGTAPLTWGQLAIWKTIAWMGDEAHYFNVRRLVDLPEGVTVDGAVEAVARLVARHEALRTRWEAGAEEPSQTVSAEGTVDVLVVPVPLEGARESAEERTVAQAAGKLPGADGMPGRFTVFAHGDTALHIGMVVTHQAVDSWSMRVMERELRLLATGGQPDADAWQPRDQVAVERAPGGAARSKGALRYWERNLEKAPATMFGPSPQGAPEDPERFVRLGMDSPALAIAATALADHCRTSVSTVLLAATSAVVGRFAGRDSVVLQLIAFNRVDPRTDALVGSMTENALFTVDGVDRGDFADLVTRTHDRAMLAYQHARYHPLELDRLLDRLTEQRGARPDLGCFFNDARLQDRWPDTLEPLPTEPGAVERLRARTRIHVEGTWAAQDATFFAHTTYSPDSARFFVMADTLLLPRTGIEESLRETERVVLDAALRLAAAPTPPEGEK